MLPHLGKPTINIESVIISPLVSLIDDQVEGLRQNGIEASKIHYFLKVVL